MSNAGSNYQSRSLSSGTAPKAQRAPRGQASREVERSEEYEESHTDGSKHTGQTEVKGQEAEPPDVPTQPTKLVKRAVDVLFSLIGLVLTAPVWAVLPVLIKLEDGGPVFYRQERVGKGGDHFKSLKFRSMRPRQGEDGPLAQAENEQFRITRVGAFMRRCALDELPQLINILKGDMSLVGPRPLLPEEVEYRTESEEPIRLSELPGYEERHSIRPGLTGIAQTQLARDVPHEKKFRYDLRYVHHRTTWLDLKLIVQSVVISILGRWPEVERRED